MEDIVGNEGLKRKCVKEVGILFHDFLFCKRTDYTITMGICNSLRIGTPAFNALTLS